MFRVKICGITNVEDAVAALDAGADAFGLNFYEKSSRYVTLRTARAISNQLYDAAIDRPLEPGLDCRVYPVGVFVNHTPKDLRRIFNAARLVAAQLHGDEPPEMIGDLFDVPVIRVTRLCRDGNAQIVNDLAACRCASLAAPNMEVVSPCAVLADAMTPNQYGGTGETVSWVGLADHRRWLGDTPLILAGGLTPDNVAEAIRIVKPAAVDVASGVESSPGKKDPIKVRDFVAAARAAFDSIQGERGA